MVKFGLAVKKNFVSNQKLFYGTIKQLRQRNDLNMLNITYKERSVITDEVKTIKVLTEDNIREAGNKNVSKDDGKKELIKEEEILEVVYKLKLGKAPGSDNITAEMLRCMGEAATKE